MKHTLQLYKAEIALSLPLPFVDQGIRAGFPSPAQDYIDNTIDLNKHLVKNPSSTFYARVVGDSMIDEDIEEGDILVIDKSLTAEKFINENKVFCIKEWYDLPDNKVECTFLVNSRPKHFDDYVNPYLTKPYGSYKLTFNWPVETIERFLGEEIKHWMNRYGARCTKIGKSSIVITTGGMIDIIMYKLNCDDLLKSVFNFDFQKKVDFYYIPEDEDYVDFPPEEYQSVKIVLYYDVQFINSDFKSGLYGVSDLKEWVEEYESSHFTQMNENTVLITSVYNLECIIDWFKSRGFIEKIRMIN